MDETSIKDYLIQEYQYFAEQFKASEETGEKRITYYVTLVGAVLAAVVNFYVRECEVLPQYKLLIPFLIIISLNGLLYLGLMIYLRLKKRNAVTDSYKNNLNEIRRIFKCKFDKDVNFLEDYSLTFDARVKWAGLKDIAAVLNIVLVIFLICVLVFHCIELWSAHRFFAVGLSLGCVPAIILHGKTFYENFHTVMIKPTHSGCIAYKMVNLRKKFLIITSRNSLQDWVLPKGHIEQGESPEDAALRELKEETGLEGVIEQRLAYTDTFTVTGKSIIVEYFLTRVHDKEISSPEKRQLEWVSLCEAIEMLTYKEAKEVLKRLL